jgi:RimJ/RimL family protein N-acetyltransferase
MSTAPGAGPDPWPDPWPLAGLVLRTPRLELRPDDDTGLRELVGVAYGGVHPPEEMPFTQPWTDADPRYLGRGSLQYFWRARADLGPERWAVNFLVRLDGRVIGTQGLMASGFAQTREVSSGSWLGLAHQRRGLGTEMRAAVLGFAFDHLDAQTARSEAFLDNPASLAVSRRLGYREDGTRVEPRRGTAATLQRVLLDRAGWNAHRPHWSLEVSGLEPCLGLLGAA